MGPIARSVTVTINDLGDSDIWSYYAIKDDLLIIALHANWHSQNQGFHMLKARFYSRLSRREWFANVWGTR